MIAPLVLLFVFSYLWLKREYTVLIWTAFLSLIYLSVTLLVLYELVYTSPDLTYGSDARYYWKAAIDVLSGDAHWMDFSAPLYVLWVTTVSLLSPSVSFAWLLLANIALFSATFALQGVAVRRFVIQNWKEASVSVSRRAVAILALMYFNGIIMWTVARGLKEVLIWFLVTLSVVTTSHVLKGMLAWCLWYLRPMGAALVIVPTMGSLFNRLSSSLRINPFLALVVVIPIAYELFAHVQLLAFFRERFGMEEGLTSVPMNNVFLLPFLGSYVSIARFILGPGPTRAIEQLMRGDVFEVSTKVGDVLIFLGSVHWWGVLLYVSYFLFSKKGRKSFAKTIQVFGSWFWLGVAITLVYAFIYFGTGDTRHRATLYVFMSPFLAVLLARAVDRVKLHKS